MNSNNTTKEIKMVNHIVKVYHALDLPAHIVKVSDFWYVVTVIDDAGRCISYVICKGTICYSIDEGKTFSERIDFEI